MRTIAFVMMLLTSLARAAPPPTGTSGPLLLPTAVSFVNNRTYDDALLRRALTDASCHSIEEAQDAVEKFYVARGFLTVVVQIMPGPPNEAGKLMIDEGPIYSVRKVEFVEVSKQPPRDALGDPKAVAALLTTKPHERFDRTILLRDFDAIRDRYDAAGYGNVLITPITDIDVDTKSVGVRIELERNFRYTISGVEIVGSDGALASKVRALLGLRAGDVFSRRRLKVAEENLKKSALVKNASVIAETLDDPKAPVDKLRVVVHVDPR